jgi:hypothetical protein
MMLVRLVLPRNSNTYQVQDMMENIGSEILERILVYGVPEEDGYGFF